MTYQKGDNIIQLAPADRKEHLLKTLNRAIRGETVRFEVSFTNTYGDEFYTDCKYTPICNNRQEITGVCVLLTDITTKKELQASEIKLKLTEEKHKESSQLFEQFMESSRCVHG